MAIAPGPRDRVLLGSNRRLNRDGLCDLGFTVTEKLEISAEDMQKIMYALELIGSFKNGSRPRYFSFISTQNEVVDMEYIECLCGAVYALFRGIDDGNGLCVRCGTRLKQKQRKRKKRR